MNEKISDLQSRVYLEAARFHYQQMQANFQDRARFMYSLLAFLPIARSVTLIFQKEFHENEKLMAWYNGKVKDWENNKVMKFFIEIRNISLKEHTPKTKVTATVSFSGNASLTDRIEIVKTSPNGKVEQIKAYESVAKPNEKEKEAEVKANVVSYSFHELPEWFDENPDVMSLCKKYLDELEKFVTEAEKRE